MNPLYKFISEFTGVVDPRFHEHMSKEIPDPEYRHKLYTLTAKYATSDGSDPRILCMTCINESNGDAKLRGILLVNSDPVLVVSAIAALRMLMNDQYPTYKVPNLCFWYLIDGSEQVVKMTDCMADISVALGSKIDALKNSTIEAV